MPVSWPRIWSYGTGGFVSVGHGLNAKNHKAPRFRMGKKARRHHKGLWPVRRRIFPAGRRKRRGSTTKKRMGWEKISPKEYIERMSQLVDDSCIVPPK
jgi:hypothetical protein